MEGLHDCVVEGIPLVFYVFNLNNLSPGVMGYPLAEVANAGIGYGCVDLGLGLVRGSDGRGGRPKH